MHQGVLTFDIFSPRLSLELLALSGVIVSFLASIWAAQTLSWWFDRLHSTCGRLWCPTPPELFERSSQPSSVFCWASWLPPALTRERYYSFELCKHTLFLCSLVGACQQSLLLMLCGFRSLLVHWGIWWGSWERRFSLRLSPSWRRDCALTRATRGRESASGSVRLWSPPAKTQWVTKTL